MAREIFEMYADGKGFKTICKWLNGNGHRTTRGNPWKAASFSRMLRNEIYIGNLVYNKEMKRSKIRSGGSCRMKPEEEWIRNEGAVDPIVPVEIFERVQVRLALQGRSHGQHHASRYLLSGFIKCGICECAYFGRTTKKVVNGKTYSYAQYVCSNPDRPSGKRDNVNLKGKWFEDLVMERLFHRILSEANVLEKLENEAEEQKCIIDEKQREIRELEKEKKKLGGILEKYFSAFENGKLDPGALKKQIEKHQSRHDQVEVEIREMRNWVSAFKDNASRQAERLLTVDMEEMWSLFNSLSVESRKEFLKAFIREIVILPDRYRIHYTLPSGLEMDHIDELLGGSGGFAKKNSGDSVNESTDAPKNHSQKKGKQSGKGKPQTNKGKNSLRVPSEKTHLFVNETSGEGSMLSHLHKEVYKESWSPTSLCKGLVIEPRNP